jgi:pyruvate/2-oxoglutarate dehydrogenase complex dihydrolipoamide dehydrogenase (E3) component
MKISRLHSLLLLTSKSSRYSSSTSTSSCTTIMTAAKWTSGDQELEAKKLNVWPLDDYNAELLNQVTGGPDYLKSTDVPHEVYDLIAIGAGAGGLVSSRQAGRRGAKSAMISEHLAGGDCLVVGCVPSKALIRVAKAITEVKRAGEFGIVLPPGEVTVDFSKIMQRMRQLRAKISPADSHEVSVKAGVHVYNGRGKFTGPNTIQVGDVTLNFKNAVVASGGRPSVPNVPGLKEAPYTTNEVLFNLEVLPPRMVILGAGVVALEMAQCFAKFGSHVTVLQRSKTLFQSKQGDPEAAEILQKELEKSGVHFVSGSTKQVETLRGRTNDPKELPLMKMTVETDQGSTDLECECLLVATGRVANVENMGLEDGQIEYEVGKGIKVNDLAQSVSNPNVYAIGDCVAGVPRLTHMSGEMAKLAVENSLFDNDWKLSSFVVPATMYTEPEYATVGISSVAMGEKQGIKVQEWKTGLEHNDRGILESSNVGFCKIFCKEGTDEIVGATIVADRAGEMINEVTLAMKNNVGLRAVGRNIHCYPTTGEAVGFCGVQYINSQWKTMN